MKKYAFPVLFILALFLISSVSASELSDDNLTEIDEDMESTFHNTTFADLSQKINDTPENQTLTLTDDYQYDGGDIHGIVISKSITIDGAGHTIDANHSSRIFNVTADNVVLKNINFVNGNALGKYFNSEVGGGAIHWTGANGQVFNCSFTNNTGSGIEDDPFDKEDETVVGEDGQILHVVRTRPMGARINEGGAITWRGENGTVSNCTFRNNHVGYPDGGGAICWRGNNGKITDSVFLNNGAWVGCAVEWRGENGLILSSKFFNRGLTDNGIFWSGNNGTVRNSILISPDGRNVINMYNQDLSADFNYWGDDISNPNQYAKPDNVNYWYVSTDTNVSFDRLEINSSFVLVNSIPEASPKILSNDLTIYYGLNMFRIQVFDRNGNPAGYADITFYINNHEYHRITDGNGYASLDFKLKPGSYDIFSQYGGVIVKNKIKVKTTLITKNIYKKVKKSAKFKIKVLNSKGKAFKKQNVKIRFKGKTYKLKTNKNGIAIFKVPKNLKAGKYTIKTNCNGITNSNRIIVKK